MVNKFIARVASSILNSLASQKGIQALFGILENLIFR